MIVSHILFSLAFTFGGFFLGVWFMKREAAKIEAKAKAIGAEVVNKL